ncbi:MAG: WxcM-like domain-containing protein [Gammaproteobacteria bacterium]|nr:WxcM-like domain-containing protein [Gammaproteobacteria bacterium]
MNFNEIYWISFQDNIDDRGRLTAIEESTHIPFKIKRIFYVHNVKPDTDRGGHAHYDTDQVITAVGGALKVDVSDGKDTKTYILNSPDKGIFVPKMYWIRLYDFQDNGICLVFASTLYDIKKSYRTWEDYLSARNLSSTRS